MLSSTKDGVSHCMAVILRRHESESSRDCVASAAPPVRQRVRPEAK
jgi:hypothetical protein